MESLNKNSSPKVSAIQLLGKNLDEIKKEITPVKSVLKNTVKITPEFQLPLPSKLHSPVMLSADFDEALSQLRYLYEAQLITKESVYFWYTSDDPADFWPYNEGFSSNYKSNFIDWVWAEDDIRESRKDDIFRLRRLFAEDESEIEDAEESNDPRNQREGDTSVYWLVDYCRYIEDMTLHLPYSKGILYKHRMGKTIIVAPETLSRRRFSENRRFGCK